MSIAGARDGAGIGIGEAAEAVTVTGGDDMRASDGSFESTLPVADRFFFRRACFLCSIRVVDGLRVGFGGGGGAVSVVEDGGAAAAAAPAPAFESVDIR